MASSIVKVETSSVQLDQYFLLPECRYQIESPLSIYRPHPVISREDIRLIHKHCLI